MVTSFFEDSRRRVGLVPDRKANRTGLTVTVHDAIAASGRSILCGTLRSGLWRTLRHPPRRCESKPFFRRLGRFRVLGRRHRDLASGDAAIVIARYDAFRSRPLAGWPPPRVNHLAKTRVRMMPGAVSDMTSKLRETCFSCRFTWHHSFRAFVPRLFSMCTSFSP